MTGSQVCCFGPCGLELPAAERVTLIDSNGDQYVFCSMQHVYLWLDAQSTETPAGN